jgi:hypothetical protein
VNGREEATRPSRAARGVECICAPAHRQRARTDRICLEQTIEQLGLHAIADLVIGSRRMLSSTSRRNWSTPPGDAVLAAERIIDSSFGTVDRLDGTSNCATRADPCCGSRRDSGPRSRRSPARSPRRQVVLEHASAASCTATSSPLPPSGLAVDLAEVHREAVAVWLGVRRAHTRGAGCAGFQPSSTSARVTGLRLRDREAIRRQGVTSETPRTRPGT